MNPPPPALPAQAWPLPQSRGEGRGGGPPTVHDLSVPPPICERNPLNTPPPPTFRGVHISATKPPLPSSCVLVPFVPSCCTPSPTPSAASRRISSAACTCLQQKHPLPSSCVFVAFVLHALANPTSSIEKDHLHGAHMSATENTLFRLRASSWPSCLRASVLLNGRFSVRSRSTSAAPPVCAGHRSPGRRRTRPPSPRRHRRSLRRRSSWRHRCRRIPGSSCGCWPRASAC